MLSTKSRRVIPGWKVWVIICSILLIGTLPTKAQSVIVVSDPNSSGDISLGMGGSQFEWWSFQTKYMWNNRKSELLENWRSVPVKFLRYPGGTPGDHYVWDNPSASHGYNASQAADFYIPLYDSDPANVSFYQICQEVGATPVMQINVLFKNSWKQYVDPSSLSSIREGAQWQAGLVADCLAKGLNIHHWEIGNETWIWLQPDEYALIVEEYSAAIKQVDPNAVIIACGLSSTVGPFNVSWWSPDTSRTANTNHAADWNDAVLSRKTSIDYIAPHYYMSYTTSQTNATAWFESTRQVIWDSVQLTELDDAFTRNSVSINDVKVFPTEWACNFIHSVPGGGGGYPADRWKLYYYQLGNGLNEAHFFGTMLNKVKTDLAIHHSLDDSATTYLWGVNQYCNGQPLEHPSQLAMKMWGHHLGNKRLNRTYYGPTLSGNDLVYTFASMKDTGERYLVAINMDPNNAYPTSWFANVAVNRYAEISFMQNTTGTGLGGDNFDAWNNNPGGQPNAPIKIVQYGSKVINNGGSRVDVSQVPPGSMLGIAIYNQMSNTLNDDIGSPSPSGSYTLNGDVYNIQSSGTRIGGTADSSNYTYCQLDGDGAIVARVNSLTNTGSQAGAGVMIRQSLNADSKQVSVVMRPDGSINSLSRQAVGGATAQTAVASAAFPRWVKIQRNGNLIKTYYKNSSGAWSLIAKYTNDMPSNIYVGLAVASGSAGNLTAANMDTIGLSGNTN